MRKKLFILFLSCLSIGFTPTENLRASDFNVPFQNIPFSSGETITADYSFGPHAIIFCYDNTLMANPIISWTFHGATQSSNLPIFLKTKANFEGEFADPNGTITIFNNTKNLVVNCVFGY